MVFLLHVRRLLGFAQKPIRESNQTDPITPTNSLHPLLLYKRYQRKALGNSEKERYIEKSEIRGLKERESGERYAGRDHDSGKTGAADDGECRCRIWVLGAYSRPGQRVESSLNSPFVCIDL